MSKTIITGTTQGLGKELFQLLNTGEVITINRRVADSANEINCDLRDKSSVERTADNLLAQIDPANEVLFILNAADYGEDNKINDIEPVELGQLVYVNVFSQLSLVEKLLSKNIKVKLVAISSPMGSISLASEPYHFAYGGSKAALNLSIRLLYTQFPKRLSYLIVDPGWMRTQMGGDSAPEDPATVAQNVIGAMKVADNWNRSDGMVEVNQRRIVAW